MDILFLKNSSTTSRLRNIYPCCWMTLENYVEWLGGAFLVGFRRFRKGPSSYRKTGQCPTQPLTLTLHGKHSSAVIIYITFFIIWIVLRKVFIHAFGNRHEEEENNKRVCWSVPETFKNTDDDGEIDDGALWRSMEERAVLHEWHESRP